MFMVPNKCMKIGLCLLYCTALTNQPQCHMEFLCHSRTKLAPQRWETFEFTTKPLVQGKRCILGFCAAHSVDGLLCNLF